MYPAREAAYEPVLGNVSIEVSRAAIPAHWFQFRGPRKADEARSTGKQPDTLVEEDSSGIIIVRAHSSHLPGTSWDLNNTIGLV